MSYKEEDFEYLGDSNEYDCWDDLIEETEESGYKFINSDYVVVDGSVYKLKEKVKYNE